MPNIHLIGGPNAGERMAPGIPPATIRFGTEKYWMLGSGDENPRRYRHDDLFCTSILAEREDD